MVTKMKMAKICSVLLVFAGLATAKYVYPPAYATRFYLWPGSDSAPGKPTGVLNDTSHYRFTYCALLGSDTTKGSLRLFMNDLTGKAPTIQLVGGAGDTTKIDTTGYYTTGNVTADSFFGDGSQLSGVAPAGDTLTAVDGLGVSMTITGTSPNESLAVAVDTTDTAYVNWIETTGGAGKVDSGSAANTAPNADAVQGKDTTYFARLNATNTFTGGQQTITGNASTDCATLGPELLTAEGWTVGAGWTESPAGTFTHTSGGGTAPLTHSATIENATRYSMCFSRSSLPTGACTLSLGGCAGDIADFAVFGPTTVSTAGVSFTPTDNYNGTISSASLPLSLKKVTGVSTAMATLSPTSGYAIEVRNPTGLGSGPNTFIGNLSGSYNVRGSYCTGYGYNALENNSSGTQNTAVGGKSQHYNTTGYLNTSIGYGSMHSNLDGCFNTAAGVSALRDNTHGWFNTALGEQALAYNLTGFGNQADGYESNWLNTTGGYNSSSGWKSLHGNVSGSCNSALGGQAGSFISGGTDATAPESSVYIGYNSRALGAADTNEIVIGTNTVGAGKNTVTIGNSNITSNTMQRKLIVGTLVLGDTVMIRTTGGAAFAASTRFSTYADSCAGVDTVNLAALNASGVRARVITLRDSVFVKNGATVITTLTTTGKWCDLEYLGAPCSRWQVFGSN